MTHAIARVKEKWARERGEIPSWTDRARDLLAPATEFSLDQISESPDVTVLGRMSGGLDPSEFDQLPPRESLLAGDDATTAAPDIFTPPPEDKPFSLFREKVLEYAKAAPAAKVFRVDDDATLGAYASERAVAELARRVRDLRAAIEAHAADQHGGEVVLPPWSDVLGEARAIRKLRQDIVFGKAEPTRTVPLCLPPEAKGRVKCWRDGDRVVCSLRFSAPDGTSRTVSSSVKPRVEATSVLGAARRLGMDPILVLGVLPDLAAQAAGKRLVRDLAGAAEKIARKPEVCRIAHPVFFTNTGPTVDAPVAAVMDLHQRAEAGDTAAAEEISGLCGLAATPAGKKIDLVLGRAWDRLATARRKKAGFFGRLRALYDAGRP